jgi:hypothetical protein
LALRLASRWGPEEAGIASALLNASQQIGVAFGLAVLSTISIAATASRLPDALGALYIGREAANDELVRSAIDALIHGYGLALAGGAAALVVATAVTTLLVNAQKGQVALH